MSSMLVNLGSFAKYPSINGPPVTTQSHKVQSLCVGSFMPDVRCDHQEVSFLRLGDPYSNLDSPLITGGEHPKSVINPNTSGSGEVCGLCERRGMIRKQWCGRSVEGS